MSAAKKPGQNDVIAAWTPEEINRLELSFLHKMFDCTTVEGVDVAVSYAKFMSKEKLDSDNYPVFLKLLQFENHWVVDALLGSNDPEFFFRAVQPNQFILASCFKMFVTWRPSAIYPKSLLVLLGLLRSCYEHPREGYRLYPLSVTELNNLGKHLDEDQDQKYPLNQTILHILDRVASLADPGGPALTDKDEIEVATQSNNIRGKFLDSTKHLREAIPTELLKKGDYRKTEIAPSWTKKERAS